MFGADENKLYMETFHAHSVISKSLEKFLSPVLLRLMETQHRYIGG